MFNVPLCCASIASVLLDDLFRTLNWFLNIGHNFNFEYNFSLNTAYNLNFASNVFCALF